MEKLLSGRAAAEYIGVALKTFQRSRLRSSNLKWPPPPGVWNERSQRWYYSTVDLDAWLEEYGHLLRFANRRAQRTDQPMIEGVNHGSI